MKVCSFYQKYEILDHQIPKYMLRTCTKKQPISNLPRPTLEAKPLLLVGEGLGCRRLTVLRL